MTLLVGVDAVKRGAEAPDDLPASWSPVSVEDAAGRARTFALQAALVWAVESLFGYISSLTKARPAILAEQAVNAINQETNRENKLIRLRSGLGLAEGASSALVRAAVVWRNKLTHVHATNTVDREVRRFLVDHSDQISQEFQGLNVGKMLERIGADQSPRLKESAAVNRAISAITKEMDAAVCDQVNVESYFSSIIVHHLGPINTRGRRAQGLWGGTAQQNRRSLMNLAAQHGLRTDAEVGFSSELPALTSRDAMARLGIS